MHSVGFEPKISKRERPQNYALDRAATGNGKTSHYGSLTIVETLLMYKNIILYVLSTPPREVNWGATWINKVAAPVQKIEINGRGDLLRWPRDTLYQQKLALTSPTGGGRSVGIVRSRIKATEFYVL